MLKLNKELFLEVNIFTVTFLKQLIQDDSHNWHVCVEIENEIAQDQNSSLNPINSHNQKKFDNFFSLSSTENNGSLGLSSQSTTAQSLPDFYEYKNVKLEQDILNEEYLQTKSLSRIQKLKQTVNFKSRVIVPILYPLKQSIIFMNIFLINCPHRNNKNEKDRSLYGSFKIGRAKLICNQIVLPFYGSSQYFNSRDNVICEGLMEINVLDGEQVNTAAMKQEIFQYNKQFIIKSLNEQSNSQKQHLFSSSLLLSNKFNIIEVYYMKLGQFNDDALFDKQFYSQFIILFLQGYILKLYFNSQNHYEILDFRKWIKEISYCSLATNSLQKIFITGGVYLSKGFIKSDCWQYCPFTDKIVAIPSLSTPRFAHSSLFHQGMLFVVGGRSYNEKIITSCEILDSKMRWRSVGDISSQNNKGQELVSIGDRLFVYGIDNDFIEEWDTQNEVWLPIEIKRQDNINKTIRILGSNSEEVLILKISEQSTSSPTEEQKLLELWKLLPQINNGEGNKLQLEYFGNTCLMLEEMEQDQLILYNFSLKNIILVNIETLNEDKESSLQVISLDINNSIHRLIEHTILIGNIPFISKENLYRCSIAHIHNSFNNLKQYENSVANKQKAKCQYFIQSSSNQIEILQKKLESPEQLHMLHSNNRNSNSRNFYNNNDKVIQRCDSKCEGELLQVIDLAEIQQLILVFKDKSNQEQKYCYYSYCTLTNKLSLIQIPVNIHKYEIVYYQYCGVVLFVSRNKSYIYNPSSKQLLKLKFQFLENLIPEYSEIFCCQGYVTNTLILFAVDIQQLFTIDFKQEILLSVSALHILPNSRNSQANPIDLLQTELITQITQGLSKDQISIQFNFSKIFSFELQMIYPLQQSSKNSFFCKQQNEDTRSPSTFDTPQLSESLKLNTKNQFEINYQLGQQQLFEFIDEKRSSKYYLIFMINNHNNNMSNSKSNNYSILKYSSEESKFTTIQCSPQVEIQPLFFHNCVSIDTQQFGILLTGGTINQSLSVNQCRLYNILTHIFIKIQNMIECRSQHSLVYKNKYFYAIGGTNQHSQILSTVERYSVIDDKWEIVSPMNIQRKNFMSCVVRDSIIVIGGIDKNNAPIQSIEISSNIQWVIVSVSSNDNMLYQGMKCVLSCSEREIFLVGGTKQKSMKDILSLNVDKLFSNMNQQKEIIIDQKQIMIKIDQLKCPRSYFHLFIDDQNTLHSIGGNISPMTAETTNLQTNLITSKFMKYQFSQSQIICHFIIQQ